MYCKRVLMQLIKRSQVLSVDRVTIIFRYRIAVYIFEKKKKNSEMKINTLTNNDSNLANI